MSPLRSPRMGPQLFCHCLLSARAIGYCASFSIRQCAGWGIQREFPRRLGPVVARRVGHVECTGYIPSLQSRRSRWRDRYRHSASRLQGQWLSRLSLLLTVVLEPSFIPSLTALVVGPLSRNIGHRWRLHASLFHEGLARHRRPVRPRHGCLALRDDRFAQLRVVNTRQQRPVRHSWWRPWRHR